MAESPFQDLIAKLAERTEEGLVNWHPTTDENEFVVFFDDFSVSLRYQSPPRDPDYCTVTLRDSSGKKLDSLLVESGEADWISTSSLYSAARRRALKVDAAITSILSELEGGNPGKRTVPKTPKVSDDDDIPF